MDDPFSVLGVPHRFTLPAGELEQRHRDLSRALHPDRYVNAPAGERRLALEKAVAVNTAFRTLRDPLARAGSLIALAGLPLTESERAPAALLMEIMDLREQLDDAGKDAKRVSKLRTEVAARITLEESVLAEVFDTDTAPESAALTRARDAVIALRYLQRFIDEADALDD